MWLYLVFTVFIHAAEPTCPTSKKLQANNLSPEAIKHFAFINKITTPEQLVCCIAELPNIQIAIAPMSDAAQNGDYQNPRVLIIQGSSAPHPQSYTSIFSINSGADHLHQKDAVEMMFNDPAGKLVFTDIDFSKGKPHFSKRNPEACMMCHGNSGKVPPHGPQPIFDPGPWPKFLMEKPEGNSRNLFGQHLCRERQKLEPLLEQAATKALSTKPRYACIKNKPRINIGVLDGLLLQQNTRSAARFISTSKDYQKFKYAIAISQFCGEWKPEQYIPENILKTMTKQDTIAPSLKNISDKKQLLQEVRKISVQNTAMANLRDAKKAASAQKIKTGDQVHFGDELADSLSCGEPMGDFTGEIPNAQEVFFPSSNAIYNRYLADAIIQSGGNPELRFLLESRGIDISHLGMRATPSNIRGINSPVVSELLNLEPPNSSFKRAFAGESPNCQLLAEESLRAFGATIDEHSESDTATIKQ